MAINNFNVGVGTTSQLTRYRYVATGGETSISGTDADGKTLSYTVGLEQVFLNGVNLVRGQDYTATNGTSIGALTALVASDSLEVFAYVPFNIANALTVSTVDAKGDLLVGTGADTVGRLAVGSNGQMLVADSTASTGLKWATAGKILQVVQGTYATETTTTSSSFQNSGLNIDITPSLASSKILVMFTMPFSVSATARTNTADSFLNIVRGSTQIWQSNAIGYSDSAGDATRTLNGVYSACYLDSPNTTSLTNYKIQFKADNVNTVTTQVSSKTSVIIAMEVGA